MDHKDTAAAVEVAKQQIKKLQDIADKQREGLAILGMVRLMLQTRIGNDLQQLIATFSLYVGTF